MHWQLPQGKKKGKAGMASEGCYRSDERIRPYWCLLIAKCGSVRQFHRAAALLIASNTARSDFVGVNDFRIEIQF